MLKDLLLAARSYRTFDESRVISEEELLGFVENTRLTPSSTNRQPLKYRLVHTREELDKIFPCTRWAMQLKDFPGPPEGKRPMAYIIICIDKGISPNTAPFYIDVGIVGQTIVLNAAEKGLGACMLGNNVRDTIPKVLGLPQEMEVALLVALGAPDETIVLEDAQPGDSVKYYRDETGTHHVPKRTLNEILL